MEKHEKAAIMTAEEELENILRKHGKLRIYGYGEGVNDPTEGTPIYGIYEMLFALARRIDR